MHHNHIIDFFCKHRECQPSDVLGPATHLNIRITRYMLYAYLHNEKRISSFKLAEIFGRTRINVLRGIRVLRGYMQYDKTLKNEYHDIVSKVEGASEDTPSTN